MTTNVFDGTTGQVATDSRWSVSQGRWLMYVDDVAFNKIETAGDVVFVFAGRGARIQQWKHWIRSAPQNLDARPPVDGISVCVAQRSNRQVLFSAKQDIVKDGASFAGTGSRYAYLCWSKNKDARRSVETAKQLDPASGGEVKFLEFATGVHNLAGPVGEVTIDMVDKAIQTRGNIMDMSSTKAGQPPFPLSRLAAGQVFEEDADLTSLRQKLAGGEVSAEAPCDGMYGDWSAEEECRLNAALGAAFGWSVAEK